MSTQQGIIDQILQERKRQDLKWGTPQSYSDNYWLGILMEEVGEAAKNAIEFSNPEDELIQVAAVALAWIEDIRWRRGVKG